MKITEARQDPKNETCRDDSLRLFSYSEKLRHVVFFLSFPYLPLFFGFRVTEGVGGRCVCIGGEDVGGYG